MITIEEIKAFFVANKEKPEVLAFLAENTPKRELTPEEVSVYLESEVGQKVLQPITDARITKALRSHDEAQAPKVKAEVDKRVIAEVAKLAPKEMTEEQKQIKELTLKFEQSEREKQNEIIKSRLSAEALKLKLDVPYLLDEFLPPTFEDGVVKLQKIKKHEDEMHTRWINEYIASNAAKPGSGNSGDPSKPDISKMDSKQKFDYFKAEAEKREAATGVSK